MPKYLVTLKGRFRLLVTGSNKVRASEVAFKELEDVSHLDSNTLEFESAVEVEECLVKKAPLRTIEQKEV